MSAPSDTSSRLTELDFLLGRWRAPRVFHEPPLGPRKPIEMRIAVPA